MPEAKFGTIPDHLHQQLQDRSANAGLRLSSIS